MRSWLIGLTVLSFGCAAAAQAQPQTTHIHVEASGGSSGGQAWIGAAPVQSQVVTGSDGQTYVGIWIDAPNTHANADRAPLDLALVVDTSGSMAGDKIANARMAASSMLESLANGDIVSIYSFSNDVTEIAAPTVISPATRGDLMQRIAGLQPTGGTNLFDGIRVGEMSAGAAPADHPVRRVVLISDGMANIGPSDPQSLGDLAAQGTESGTQVSAIGVGLDYDEQTLGALAMRSAGRLYHLQNPSEMAAILRDELDRLSNTVATDAYIEVDPSPGVQILGADSVPLENENGHVRIRLGSVTAGQHREFLLRTRVDTDQAGEHPLGAARLVFHDTGRAHAERVQNVALAYGVTADRAAATRSVNHRVQAMVASNNVAQIQLQASQAANRGERDRAVQLLGDAERELATAAADAPADERRRLEVQGGRVQRARAGVTHAATPSAARATALDLNADAYNAMGL